MATPLIAVLIFDAPRGRRRTVCPARKVWLISPCNASETEESNQDECM